MRHALAAVSEFLLNGETVDDLVQLRGEIGQRHRAEILAAAGADGDGACLHVAVADDQHKGNLLERGLADLLADLLVALVNLHAEALAVQLGGGGLGVLGGAVFKSAAAGAFLYAVQIVSAVLVCRLTAKKQYAPAKAVAKPPQPESFAAAFSESVRRAGMSAIQICMFITVFSVLSCYFLLAAGRFLPPEALPLVLGSLELSAGCAALADCALALQWKLCIASALLSFGGVSVLAQSRAAVQEHGLTGRLLLPCKALQAVLSCTLTLIAAPLLHAESWPAAAFSGTQGLETAGAASLLLCSVSLLLFRKKYHSNLHGKRV